MRTRLLLALLTVLATAALGMGPAVAAADTVTIYDSQTGEPLETGAEVNGTSEGSNIAGWGVPCEPVEFSGELTQNEAGSATVAADPAATFDCASNTFGRAEFVDFAASPIEFFPNGSVDYQVDPGELNYYSHGQFVGTCVGDEEQSSVSGAQWKSENGQAAFGSTSHKLKFFYYTCHPAIEELTMHHWFQLTGEEGQPLEIVVE